MYVVKYCLILVFMTLAVLISDSQASSHARIIRN